MAFEIERKFLVKGDAWRGIVMCLRGQVLERAVPGRAFRSHWRGSRGNCQTMYARFCKAEAALLHPACVVLQSPHIAGSW